MEKSKARDFTTGSIPRHLVSFSVPMLVGNILQVLYNTVDSIWVGRFLGPSALAAVSVGAPIVFACVALALGLSMATTTLVAQYFGAKDIKMVRKVVANSFILMIIVGAISTAAGLMLKEPLLRLINTPPEIMDNASAYLGVIFAGLITVFSYNMNSAIMRGLGDSRRPLIFLAYATVLNIVLDPILIFGYGPFPRMEVVGAAVATVIAQGLSALLGIRQMVKDGLLSLDKESWRLDLRLTKLSFTIGLPAGFQQMIVSLGMLTLTSIVNRFGPTVTASYGAGGRLDQFALLPAQSLSLAVTTLVGQNLGAGKHERVKETVRTATYLTAAITGVVSAVTLLFPEILLGMFTSSADVIAEGARYLRLVALSYVPWGLMFMLAGVLRGAGDTLPAMLISMVTLWGIRVPLAAYLSRISGSRGVWTAMAISPLGGMTLNWLYYVSGRWKRRVVTKVYDQPTSAEAVVDTAEG